MLIAQGALLKHTTKEPRFIWPTTYPPNWILSAVRRIMDLLLEQNTQVFLTATRQENLRESSKAHPNENVSRGTWEYQGNRVTNRRINK